VSGKKKPSGSGGDLVIRGGSGTRPAEYETMKLMLDGKEVPIESLRIEEPALPMVTVPRFAMPVLSMPAMPRLAAMSLEIKFESNIDEALSALAMQAGRVATKARRKNETKRQKKRRKRRESRERKQVAEVANELERLASEALSAIEDDS
jgi:hypothetical protein